MKDPKRHEEEIEAATTVPGTPVNVDDIDPTLQLPYSARRRAHSVELRSALRSDLFLGLLIFTLLNAVIFLHYARTRQAALDLKQANLIVKTELGRDLDYFLPITEFVNAHGEFSTPTDNLFASSLAKFRGRLTRFGIDAATDFQKEEFRRRNGGIYLSTGDRMSRPRR